MHGTKLYLIFTTLLLNLCITIFVKSNHHGEMFFMWNKAAFVQ